MSKTIKNIETSETKNIEISDIKKTIRPYHFPKTETIIEAESLEEAIKIYNSLNKKANE